MSIACDSTKGCTNPQACNYNSDAEINDGSCIFPVYCQDCDGICLDIGGCDPDDCGTCGGINECCSGILDCNQECDGTAWISDCGCVAADNSGDDCDDCAGIPNGSNWISDCGCVTFGNAGNNCDDCAGTPNGDAVLDECGVCNGDGTSCDASILINNWSLRSSGNLSAMNWSFIPSSSGAGWGLEAGLNCNNYDNIYCVPAFIKEIPDMLLNVNIKPYGAGFDVTGGETIPGECYFEQGCNTCTTTGISYGEGDCDVYATYPYCECPDITTGDLMTTLSDLAMTMNFAVYIKKEMSYTDPFTGVVTQVACHDIFGTEANPRISDTVEYDPAAYSTQTDLEDLGISLTFPIVQAGNHQDCEHHCDELKTGIHFFNITPVELLQVNQDSSFDATYYIKVYINEFEILGYNPNFIEANITVNDINNPITNTINIHHFPQDYSLCNGIPGDMYGNNYVNCDDYYTALLFYTNGLCNNFQDNPSAPPRCCNLAAVTPNNLIVDQSDLDGILEMITQSGIAC